MSNVIFHSTSYGVRFNGQKKHAATWAGFAGLTINSTGGPASESVFGEIPAGVINGSNATFTSAFDFIPESLQVYIGIRLQVVSDYITVGTNTLILNQSPLPGENLLIDYIKYVAASPLPYSIPHILT